MWLFIFTSDVDVSDIDSDVSLPLSSPEPSAKPVPTPRSARSQGSVKFQGSDKISKSEPQLSQYVCDNLLYYTW